MKHIYISSVNYNKREKMFWLIFLVSYIDFVFRVYDIPLNIPLYDIPLKHKFSKIGSLVNLKKPKKLTWLSLLVPSGLHAATPAASSGGLWIGRLVTILCKSLLKCKRKRSRDPNPSWHVWQHQNPSRNSMAPPFWGFLRNFPPFVLSVCEI